MTQELKNWLQFKSEELCQATLYRAPNMLVDDEGLAGFLEMLAEQASNARELQLSAVQYWAITEIGHDARAAYDWSVMLRVLKEIIGNQLGAEYEPERALTMWRALDDLMTYALIETAQLSSDINHAELLQHMSELRQNMAHFEESKSNFVTVAAHELKTPLTIVEGYANMLRAETEPEDRLRVYIEGLRSGISRMHGIISDLLDVSMLDLQSYELKYQHFYLEKIVLGVADRLDGAYKERHVDLVVMPTEMRQQMFGDPEKLAKVFAKLLANALKYTPDGGRVVVTSALTRQQERSEEMAGFIEVRIKDTGIGIDLEDQGRIFDKFWSTTKAALHSSGQTKYKGGGPGLGLSIARGIVEAHGGRIWVESEGADEEKCPGSTFFVELPIWLKPPVDMWQE